MTEPSTFVVRVWLPDRPGALGQVASRIGAVRGSVVGIDILERGGGRAVDELVVEVPDDDLVPLLVREIGQVDGVDVEDVRPVDGGSHDPRLDVLETAALLVGASTVTDVIDALCEHGGRVLGVSWSAVLDCGTAEIVASTGTAPPEAWLAAFVAGSRASIAPLEPAVDDVVWAPLPASRMAFLCGRSTTGFRARERRQAAALARIVDTRVREIAALARMRHPSY